MTSGCVRVGGGIEGGSTKGVSCNPLRSFSSVALRRLPAGAGDGESLRRRRQIWYLLSAQLTPGAASDGDRGLRGSRVKLVGKGQCHSLSTQVPEIN